MPLASKPIDRVLLADLQELITNREREGKLVEYKRDLKLESDSDKKEFLADLTSFANTAGGDLLFGVAEEAGMPTELVGLDVADEDAMRQRIENVVRTSVDPRVPGLQLRFIHMAVSRCVVVIRIGKSWAAPHMVTHSGSSRFFARNSAGKFQLDVHELRAAFIASEDIGKRMAAFRTERVGRIISNETIMPLPNGAKVIAHLLPYESFAPGESVNLTAVQELRPMGVSGWSGPTANFDGVASYHARKGDEVTPAYIQVYRNGCIEAVDAWMLSPDPWPDDRSVHQNQVFIPSTALEEQLIGFVAQNMTVLSRLGIAPPVFACFTLTGVRGCLLGVREGLFQREKRQLRLDVLQLPEIRFDELGAEGSPDVPKELRPAFDVLWNAFGWSRSMNYDDKGTWNRR